MRGKFGVALSQVGHQLFGPVVPPHVEPGSFETRYQDLDTEPINGVACHYHRFWEFTDPGLTQAWDVSGKEIWIGVESKVPIRLSCVQRMN